MNPVATSLVAGALIIAGKWSRNQELKIDNAIGIAGIALGLALMEQMNERLSRMFGILILLSLAFIHLPAIVTSLGFAS